jgi:hypothetical protein
MTMLRRGEVWIESEARPVGQGKSTFAAPPRIQRTVAESALETIGEILPPETVTCHALTALETVSGAELITRGKNAYRKIETIGREEWMPVIIEARRRFHAGLTVSDCKGIEDFYREIGVKPATVRKWFERERKAKLLHAPVQEQQPEPSPDPKTDTTAAEIEYKGMTEEEHDANWYPGLTEEERVEKRKREDRWREVFHANATPDPNATKEEFRDRITLALRIANLDGKRTPGPPAEIEPHSEDYEAWWDSIGDFQLAVMALHADAVEAREMIKARSSFSLARYGTLTHNAVEDMRKGIAELLPILDLWEVQPNTDWITGTPEEIERVAKHKAKTDKEARKAEQAVS